MNTPAAIESDLKVFRMVRNTKIEERTALAIEKIADATVAINKSVDAIFEAQKQLNDNFILHQNSTERIARDLAVTNDKTAVALVTAKTRFGMKSYSYRVS